MLGNTWNLLAEIKELNVTTDLRTEIDKFVVKYERLNTRGNKIVSKCIGIIHRGNLHYIIDNIKKPTLLQELKEFNLKQFN